MRVSFYDTEVILLRNEGEDNEEEFLLDVKYTYHPFRPASGGSRFEPPIDPPEDAFIEITRVRFEGKDFELSDNEFDYVTSVLEQDFEEEFPE